jgi:hypothetical protein
MSPRTTVRKKSATSPLATSSATITLVMRGENDVDVPPRPPTASARRVRMCDCEQCLAFTASRLAGGAR